MGLDTQTEKSGPFRGNAPALGLAEMPKVKTVEETEPGKGGVGSAKGNRRESREIGDNQEVISGHSSPRKNRRPKGSPSTPQGGLESPRGADRTAWGPRKADAVPSQAAKALATVHSYCLKTFRITPAGIHHFAVLACSLHAKTTQIETP